MAQADAYAQAIEELNEAYADDPLNQDYLDKKAEWISLQQEAIIAASEEKDAMIDLVEGGIEVAIEALENLVDEYTDALDSAKDLYEYQKNIESQVKTITDIEKQLAAYSGDNSEESRKTIQELQNELAEAQENLEETQYDQYINDQKELLENLVEEYSTLLNQRLDDVDALITDCISTINLNADTISATLQSTADSVGYTLSESITSVWDTAPNSITGLTTVLSTYSSNFSTTMTTLQATLNAIAKTVDAQYSATTSTATTTASTSTSAATKSTSTTTSGTSTSSTASSSSSSSSGSFFVTEKYTGNKSKLNINTSIVDRLKYNDFASSFSYRKKYYNKMGLGSSSSYTGTAKQNVNMLNWMKKNGYKSGAEHIALDDLAWTNENGENEVIVRPTDNAILTAVKAQDKVINADGAQNLFDFANDPSTFLANQTDMLTSLSQLKPIQAATNNIENSIDMSISLPNVTNYAEFVNELRVDPKFQKMIQSMTTDLINGGSTLSKRKYSW